MHVVIPQLFRKIIYYINTFVIFKIKKFPIAQKVPF